MTTPLIKPVSQLIRRLRRDAGMSQRQLADRVGTTQSAISRLESDDYEGHSLSMLYRIAAALDRTIVISAVDGGSVARVVREESAPYDVDPVERDAATTATTAPIATTAPTAPTAAAATTATTASDPDLVDLDRLADRLARRFRAQGVTRADVQEAIRWARRGAAGAAVERLAELRGAIEVGPGDVIDDVRRARARRGAARTPGA